MFCAVPHLLFFTSRPCILVCYITSPAPPRTHTGTQTRTCSIIVMFPETDASTFLSLCFCTFMPCSPSVFFSVFPSHSDASPPCISISMLLYLFSHLRPNLMPLSLAQSLSNSLTDDVPLSVSLFPQIWFLPIPSTFHSSLPPPPLSILRIRLSLLPVFTDAAPLFLFASPTSISPPPSLPHFLLTRHSFSQM